MFLLDTDHLSILQQQTEPQCTRLGRRMSQFAPSDFYISIVSFHEQILGWNAYLNRARGTSGVVRGYEMFQRILSDFSGAQVHSFDQAAADQFDLLRAQRIRVAMMDLRIAAIGMSRGLTLLSRNLTDFRRVPGILAEDWTV